MDILGEINKNVHYNLYYNMEQTMFLFRKPLMKIANTYSITLEQWYLLLFLDTFNGVSQNELGKLTSKDKGNISRMLSRLSQNGFIKREKSDDKKCLIYLTKEGEKIKTKLTPLLENNKSKDDLLYHLKKLRLLLGDIEV
jgi:DNA-binding MarR family transcriptional regulator